MMKPAAVQVPPMPLTVQAAKAIGHPARLRLLAMLRTGPLCVCQMTAVVALAPSTVSGHLLELRRGGLVVEEKRGKWVQYRLRADGPFRRLINEALALVEDDPATTADRRSVKRVTAVPVEAFCRTGSRIDEARMRSRGRRPRRAASARRSGR